MFYFPGFHGTPCIINSAKQFRNPSLFARKPAILELNPEGTSNPTVTDSLSNFYSPRRYNSSMPIFFFFFTGLNMFGLEEMRPFENLDFLLDGL